MFLLNRVARVKKSVVKFNTDEAGNEVIQTVMIVALAAIILIALQRMWDLVDSSTTDLLDQFFSLVF